MEKPFRKQFTEPSPSLLRRLLFACLCAVLCGGALFLFFRYLALPLLPFALSFLLAGALQKPLDLLTRRLRLPRGLLGGVLVTVLFFGFGFLLYEIIAALLSFFGSLVSDHAASLRDAVNAAAEALKAQLSRLPLFSADGKSTFFEKLFSGVDSAGKSVLRSATESLGAKLPVWLSALAAAVPKIVIFLIVTFIASIWITADYPRICAYFCKMLDGKSLGTVKKVRFHALATLRKSLRAYGALLLLTFAQLWLGLFLLGIENAAAPAALIAVVDILPVLGTGTVLIPWALLCLATSRVHLCIGLLILYAVITIVREVAEPKLVGKSIGMYPPLTLLSMYLGMKLFGIAGLFLLPLSLQILLCLRRSGKQGADC